MIYEGLKNKSISESDENSSFIKSPADPTTFYLNEAKAIAEA
jgi:hypothetical protein